MTSEIPSAVEPVHPVDRLRILIADDVMVVRHMFIQAIKPMGAEIVEAGDGERALFLLEQALQSGRPFDLLVCDLGMPKMTGQDLIRKMRSHRQLYTMPVVVLTANKDRATVVRCAQLKVKGYILKPSEDAEIIREVTTAVADHPQVIDFCRRQAREQKRLAMLGGKLPMMNMHRLRTLVNQPLDFRMDNGVRLIGRPIRMMPEHGPVRMMLCNDVRIYDSQGGLLMDCPRFLMLSAGIVKIKEHWSSDDPRWQDDQQPCQWDWLIGEMSENEDENSQIGQTRATSH